MRETERQMEEGRTDSEMATLSALSSLQDDGPKDSKMLGIALRPERE